MWTLARDCGLRMEEMLSPRVSDFPVVRGQVCVATLRRPHAVEDTRVRRPSVKTLERTLSLGLHALFALRTYLTLRAPLGRRREGPYLTTSRRGGPLSINPANHIARLLSAAVGVRVHWHALRHT